MKIPESFREDLRRAYEGHITLDQLIIRSHWFFQRLSEYFLRHRSPWQVSEVEDLVQEASDTCINALWNWDETRGPTLDAYVVYQIGSRLKNMMRDERRRRRHPESSFRGVLEDELVEDPFNGEEHTFGRLAVREAWSQLRKRERVLLINRIDGRPTARSTERLRRSRRIDALYQTLVEYIV